MIIKTNSRFRNNIKKLKISAILIFVWLFISCASTQIGSGYERIIGAEKHSGHFLFFFNTSNAGARNTANIKIYSGGQLQNEYKFTQPSWDVAVLRRIDNEYTVKIDYETDMGFFGKVVGDKEVSFIAEKGKVFGLYLETRPKILGSNTVDVREVVFTGRTAHYILNPGNEIFIWEELEKMNNSPNNDTKLSDKTTPTGDSNTEIEEKLINLKKLYDNRTITKEEYNALRKSLIDKL